MLPNQQLLQLHKLLVVEKQLVELLDSNPKDLPRFKDLRERLVLLLRDRGNDPEPPPGAPVRTADNPRSPSLS